MDISSCGECDPLVADRFRRRLCRDEGNGWQDSKGPTQNEAACICCTDRPHDVRHQPHHLRRQPPDVVRRLAHDELCAGRGTDRHVRSLEDLITAQRSDRLCGQKDRSSEGRPPFSADPQTWVASSSDEAWETRGRRFAARRSIKA